MKASERKIKEAMELLISEGFHIRRGHSSGVYLLRDRRGGGHYLYTVRRTLEMRPSTRYAGKMGFIAKDAEYCEIDPAEMAWKPFPFPKQESER